MTQKLINLIIILLFLSFNILFNFRIWATIFSHDPKDLFPTGESSLAEFTLEMSFRNILQLKNPYLISNSMLYPYSQNLAMNDPGVSNLIFYIFLRPLFSTHVSMLIIVLMNNLLSSILMYALLRKFNIKYAIATLFALCFSFTPFISHRVDGHYIYTSLFIFPLFFLIVYSYFQTKSKIKKLTYSIFTGVLFAFILMLNLYYLMTIFLIVSFYTIYYLLFQRKIAFNILKNGYFYLAITLLSFLIASIPWVYPFIKLLQLEGLVKTPGFGGANQLSADVLSFIIPSEYNPFYHYIINQLAKVSVIFINYQKVYLSSWDKFVYPGIIILVTYLGLVFWRKKLPLSLRKKIWPHFLISIIFVVLTLGPFLKVFNRWMIQLEDVSVVFPLPFLLFHYIPGLTALRAPTRFIPAFVFLASIISAQLLNFLLPKVFKKHLVIIILIYLLLIFDQFYIVPKRTNRNLPVASYQLIKRDDNFFSVMEIPFTVRDGFDYIGYVHAIDPMTGSLIYHKPIIGGYTARVHPSIFSYYKNLPFIGYIAQIIDKGNYNPDKELPGEPRITLFQGNFQQAMKELDFLDVKYIILKTDEKYSPLVIQLLYSLGYHKQLFDGGYDLYIRQPTPTNFEEITFGSPDDYLYTAAGFSIRENGFRWTEGKLAKIFLKTNNLQKTKLTLQASSFYEPQEIEVYLNDYKVGKKTIGIEKTHLSFNISGKIRPGINTVIIRFTKNFKPSYVIPKEKDQRNLAAQLFFISIN